MNEETKKENEVKEEKLEKVSGGGSTQRQCPYCSRVFSGIDYLNLHIAEVHGNEG